MLPCVGREPSVSLSPVEADSRAVMQPNMRFRVPDGWSILLTFEKLKGWTGCTSNAVALQKNDPGTGLWGLGLRRVIWGERRWSGQRRSAASRSHPTWRRWSLLLTSE